MNGIISKDGYYLEFPVVNIGQIDNKTLTKLQYGVKKDTIIKYEDYSFPKIKTGYTKTTMRDTKAQSLLESLKSLFNGSWIYVPDALQKVEHNLITQLKQLGYGNFKGDNNE